MKIATAVTTAPRKTDYLPATLESIRAAGFDDPVIFAEPGSLVPPGFEVEWAPWVRHAWPAYLRAVEDLLNLFPDDDALAIFQDDILLARGLAEWLPTQRDKIVHAGVISLFTPEALPALLNDHAPGWHETPERLMPAKVPPAQALVMPRWAAEKLMVKPVIGHDSKPVERHVVGAGTDFWLGLWCKQQGLAYMFHQPSLSRHVGAVSAIERGIGDPGLNEWRREGAFAEEIG